MASSWKGRGSRGQGALLLAVVALIVALGGQDIRGEPAGGKALHPRATPSPLSDLPDPVLIQGQWVPAFLGTDLETLRLLRWDGDGFIPIRFQVDERTPRGERVFPFGRKNNREEGNGRLDKQDEIVFMAREAGPRAPGRKGPEGTARLTEICLTEQDAGRRGWIYLAAFPGNGPPLSDLPDLVRYDPVHEILASDCFQTEFLITEEGLHTSYYLRQSTPVEGGGTGRNILDRLKLQIQIRFFFNLVPLVLTEEKLGSDVVAYIQGPVRVIRRQEQFLKLPLGLRAVRSYSEMATYENMAIVPIAIHVPQGISGIVSSAVFRYGIDYAPGVIGAFFRNSETREPLIVDGRMSEAEQFFPAHRDSWRLFYGPDGFLMSRFFIPESILDFLEFRQGYIDDILRDVPPERFPGSIGYAYTEIRPREIRSGVYRVSLDLYFPCNYRPGDERRYLRFRDAPLVVSINGRTYPNTLGSLWRELEPP